MEKIVTKESCYYHFLKSRKAIVTISGISPSTFGVIAEGHRHRSMSGF